MNLKPYIAISEGQIGPSGPIAITSPAAPEDVKAVMMSNLEGMEGRSEFVWLRLANNDIAMAVFPQGETLEQSEGLAGNWGDGSHERGLPSGSIQSGDEIAFVHLADPELVRSFMELNLTENAEPNWSWIKMADGDLALGVFHQGELPDFLARDAEWPGVLEDNPGPGM